MNYAGIIGNNARNSTNRTLLQYIQKHFGGSDQITLCEIKDVPFFNKPASHVAPPEVAKIAAAIEQADGVIIATPEYDHTVPAVLSNTLEWLAYTTDVLKDKPVFIVGASYGALGTSRAQGHLRIMLNGPDLGARVLPGQEYLLGHSLQAFDEDGMLVEAEDIQSLEDHMKYFAEFVKSNQGK